MKHRNLAMVLMAVLVCPASAQNNNTKDDFFSKHSKGFGKAREEMYKDFNDFRKKAYEEYTEFVRNAWKDFNKEPARPMPKEEEVKPMIAAGADEKTASFFGKLFGVGSGKRERTSPKPAVKKENKKGEVFEVQNVIQPAPKFEQPQPLSEVKQVTSSIPNPYMEFRVFGTTCKVRIGENCRFKVRSVEPDDVADAMEKFTKPQFDNMLYDCLQERKKHNFADWAYYQMLIQLTDKFYGKDTNEGMLARAFLYSQSGYKMRLAQDGSKIHMLVASRHHIFGKEYFYIDGEAFYLLEGKGAAKMSICEAKFPKESSLSLQMTAVQELSADFTPQRTIESLKNPEFSFTIKSNKNYIDFYQTYPSSSVNDNFMTRWAMYANTPLEKGIADQLYPQMKAKLEGRSQLDAVSQLLWWVQGTLWSAENPIENCMLYRYDEEVWGYDRAFFGEETLFYPYCDCEDRSILLSHLVRDLVGLDVVLVYYPGHLAMAVNFTDNVEGDCIMYDNRKFVVCDPTYIGADVGETMPNMKGLKTTVILLDRS